MEEYTCMIPRDTHDGAFYRAVLALHQDLFSLAQQVILFLVGFPKPYGELGCIAARKDTLF